MIYKKYTSFSSAEEQAVRVTVGFIPSTLESLVLHVQGKGEWDCTAQNLKVGASNLESMDSMYMGGHTVFWPPSSHSPHF